MEQGGGLRSLGEGRKIIIFRTVKVCRKRGPEMGSQKGSQIGGEGGSKRGFFRENPMPKPPQIIYCLVGGYPPPWGVGPVTIWYIPESGSRSGSPEYTNSRRPQIIFCLTNLSWWCKINLYLPTYVGDARLPFRKSGSLRSWEDRGSRSPHSPYGYKGPRCRERRTARQRHQIRIKKK